MIQINSLKGNISNGWLWLTLKTYYNDSTFTLTKGISLEMAITNAISNRSWNTLKKRKINNRYYIPIHTSIIISITKPMIIYK